jgi:hypothetical protein
MNNERIFCNECRTITPHSVETAKIIEESTEECSASTTHQVLICASCSTGTYRKRFWFSEWQDHDPESGPTYEDTYHPPGMKKLLPAWHDQLPEVLQEVMKEAYVAFQYDLRYISSVGLRTALDIAIVEKVGDLGRFTDKLEKMVELAHISTDEKDLMGGPKFISTF